MSEENKIITAWVLFLLIFLFLLLLLFNVYLQPDGYDRPANGGNTGNYSESLEGEGG